MPSPLFPATFEGKGGTQCYYGQGSGALTLHLPCHELLAGPLLS